MKLSVRDRLKLMTCIPTQGSLAKMKVIKGLKKKLSFTEDEHVEFGMKVAKPVVCDSCNNQFVVSDANINPEESTHSCPNCGSIDFTETGQQQVNWNIEAEREADLDFSVEEMSMIAETLEILDSENKVTEEMIDLYEKFSINC